MIRCCSLSVALCTLVSVVNPMLAAEPSNDQPARLNTLTAAEKSAGWKLLFDGKTTAGWRNFGKNKISDGWNVVDGVLVGKLGAGDIITTDPYGAFELVLDYKIPQGGNSGVMYHVSEEANQPYETGPEVQIYDDHGEPGAQKTGFLYQMYGSNVDATKPAGQWNQMRLLITPEKCETWINGTKYHEYVIGSDDWNQRLAKTKYKQLPHYAKRESGFICLQEHGGGQLEFRNIKIRTIAAKQ
ncbi:MAG: DUF1080 domain-containing protein [Pirellulales bacterium]|nr:DUF1080 domain-containing protein [Pirellulales bacterium]